MKSLILRKPYLYLDKDFRNLMHHLKVLGNRADELKQESVTKLTGALTQLEGGLLQAVEGSNQLSAGARTGHTKGQEFIAGARQLEGGASQLADGVRQASSGARQLSSGAGQLADGSRRLADGTGQLQAGARALVSGMEQLEDGGHRLAEGLGRLSDGTAQLASGLGGASGARVPPRSNAPVMSQPVQVKGEKLTPVPRPGEALMAVTIPTALWLGALLLVLGGRLFGTMPNGGATSWDRLKAVALPGAILALAVSSAGLLLGPQVAHPLVLVIFAALTTFSFLAINLMLADALGYWGYGLSGLLLILMPVAVGTRAPYVLLPAFYRAAAPFLPLSHAVRGVQATVAGGANSIFWISVAALLIFLALSLGISRWAQRRGAGPHLQRAVV
jgi:putative membrane protein